MFTEFKLHPSDIAISDRGAVGMVAADAVTMPEVWLAAAGSAPRQMSHLNEEWSKIPLRPSEIVKYPSFDGAQIEAQLFKPASYLAGAKLPTVILVHGGPTGAFSERFYSWAQLLATRGYLVMCPNIRGSTGYGHKFIESNRTDWGGGDFKDVMAGVDWLVSRGDADPERLGIGGWSYGGYMAMWAITQTNRFKASVAGAGMSDLASEFGTESGSAGDEWFYGTPWEHLADFQKSSPITYVKNARTPTLILQGEADRTDPIGQSQQLYRALKRYGVKSDFVTYPREGHGIMEEKHQLDLLERMVAWFDTYVK
jgi:dipeptidyl aminopeptidase/acylaminoacyl peptidase